jgi:hypothetical protein
MGASLCFAVQNEKYWEMPLIILFPTAYSGYYAFKNKDDILVYSKKLIPQHKRGFD